MGRHSFAHSLATAIMIVGGVLTLVPPAQATNLTFIPGDACFPFSLDEATLISLERGAHTVHYRFAPHSSPAFCGNVGFTQCRLELTEDLRKSLRTVYDAYRTGDYPKIAALDRDPAGNETISGQRELNPMYGFAYRADQEVKTLRIGWRFNEDWHVLLHNAGGRGVAYDGYSSGAKELAMEWRDSGLIQALPVDRTEAFRNELNTEKDLVTITGPIKIIVVPQEEIKDVLKRQNPFGGRLAIADKQATFLKWSREKVKETGDGEWVGDDE